MPSEKQKPDLDALMKLYLGEGNYDDGKPMAMNEPAGSDDILPTNPQPTEPKPTEPVAADASPQSPIKADWKSSGGFSASPSPNHPGGHDGVDMRAPAGTPIYPMSPGVISFVGTDPKGGNVINIDHDNKLTSYCAHLSTANVQKGQRVDKNTIIGTVGKSGNASGTWPHMHFGIRETGKPGSWKDPAQYFAVPQYTDLTKEEKQAGEYVSEQAKKDALSFNMGQHLSQTTVASRKELRYKTAKNYFRKIIK